MMHPEPVIKLAGRVPIEHMKIDAAPAALDRDRGEPRRQPLADPTAARRLGDIEVFEIKAGPAEPGRKPRMEQRAPRGLAVEKSENGLEFRRGAEAVMPQIGFGRDDRIGRAFEDRELPDEAQQERHVIGGRKADRDLGHTYRSRQSRAPLPGGPKSRGAKPA